MLRRSSIAAAVSTSPSSAAAWRRDATSKWESVHFSRASSQITRTFSGLPSFPKILRAEVLSLADQTRLASLERHFSQINATLLHIYGISVQHSWQHHRFVLPFPGFLEKHDWTSHQFLRSLALEIRRRSCFSWLERGSSGFSKESLTLTLESCPVLSRTSLADCCFGRPNAHEGVLRSRTRKAKQI